MSQAPPTPRRGSTASAFSADRDSIISSASRKVVRAVYDFQESDQGDELNFTQGELIEVIQTLGDGWALGRKLSGSDLEVGLFPEVFTELVTDKGFKSMDSDGNSSRPPRSPRKISRRQSRFTEVEGGDGSEAGKGGDDDDNIPLAEVSGATKSGDSVNMVVRAMYDLTDTSAGDELVVEKGALILVKKQFDDGWWFGTCGGKAGFFPSNMVEEASVDDNAISPSNSTGTPLSVGAAAVGIVIEPQDASISSAEAVEKPAPGAAPPPAPAKKNSSGYRDEWVSLHGQRGTILLVVRLVLLFALMLPGTVMMMYALGSSRGLYGKLEAYPGYTGAQQSTIKGTVGVSGAYGARMEKYPGYTGSITAVGAVSTQALAGTNLRLSYHVTGLETSETGGIHIHTGTSCEDASSVGPHHWNENYVTDDPWKSTFYATDQLGTAHGSFEVDAGLAWEDVVGHTIVLHSSAGARIACGVIREDDIVDLHWSLSGAEATVSPGEASMARYPGYNGQFQVTGDVHIATRSTNQQVAVLRTLTGVNRQIGGWVSAEVASDTSLKMTYDIVGLSHSSTGGLHIHTGTSCTTQDAPGEPAHLYDQAALSTDPWLTTQWSSDSTGHARGSFQVSPGPSAMASFRGHAIVVHDGTQRVACGVMSEMDVMRLTYDIAGVRTNAQGGIHVHTGTSCDSASSVGGHYFADTVTDNTDPWLYTRYQSDAAGRSRGYIDVATGNAANTFAGRAVVVHDSNTGATRISCGTLAAQRVADDGQLSMAESLYGLVPREGLITVHSGSSCESADSIGQPLLTGDEDVWRNKKYLTNNAGQSRGSFPVAIGYGSSNLEGRVAVVSDSVGNRIACTQLQANSGHHQIFWAGRRHGGLAFAQIGLLVPLVCLILLSLLQVLQMLGIGPLASWSTASLSITVTAFESLLSGVWIPVFSMALGVALFISAESHVRAVGAAGAILAFLALAVSAAIDRLLLYSLRRK